MSAYRAINQAAKKIQQTLDTLHLAPVDPAHTPTSAIRRCQRYYMTPVRTKRGQLAWFKASLQDTRWLRQSLREEITIQKSLAQFESRHRLHFDSPSYLASLDDRRGFLWLLRKYWDGLYAGDMDDYFGLAPVFFRQVAPELMAKILHETRGMTRVVSRRHPPVHGLGWYLFDFHYYRQHFFRHLVAATDNRSWTKDRVDRLEERLGRERGFIRRHGTVFTHGDLYPNNIMVRPSAARRVVLFDWELSHLNLPTFDPTLIYLLAWRRPDWQRRFRSSTRQLLNNDSLFDRSWEITTISLATRLAAYCYLRLNGLQPERYPKLPARYRPTIKKMYEIFMRELEKTEDRPKI